MWSEGRTVRTHKKQFRHEQLDKDECYRYRLRGFNRNCRGKWSQSAEFTTGEGVVVQKEGKHSYRIVKATSSVNQKTGDLEIGWEGPVSHYYQVQIMELEGSWATVCQTAMLSCQVKMKKIKLPLGHLIEFRVRAGVGPWFQSSAVTVRTKPGKMSTPQRGPLSENAEKVQIAWMAPIWTKQTGGSKTLGYILQQDGKTVYSGKQTDATFSLDNRQKRYAFRVAAWNIYGLGKFSEELSIAL